MGSGDSNKSNGGSSGENNNAGKTNAGKESALNIKPGQPVSARELVDAINELATTVSTLNKAVVQLQNSMRARAKSSFSEKEEDKQPPKTIH